MKLLSPYLMLEFIVRRTGSEERKMEVQWWWSRAGGNPLAKAGTPLGPDCGLTVLDLCDKDNLHILGPFVTEINTHSWSRSKKSWCMILRRKSNCRPSGCFRPVRWIGLSATICISVLLLFHSLDLPRILMASWNRRVQESEF